MHIPVLLDEVISAMTPQDGEIYIDATFGGGGYTKSLLEKANCRVIAIDRDPEAQERAFELKKNYGDRFTFIPGTFGSLLNYLDELKISKVDGIVADLGMSSFQIDSEERGFSFKFHAPLDMRMSKNGISAADILNTSSQEELANIFYTYGDEKKSRIIAKKIVESRQIAPITTTTELVNLILCVKKHKKNDIHPATQVFQALRILVNNELGELETFLCDSIRALKTKGRLVIVSFHSLEDRIVKRTLRGELTRGIRFFEAMHKKFPTHIETAKNPRSRSARLRWALRNSVED